MFFSKNADKETLRMWQKKCHELERENLKLQSELNAIQQYKTDYENLIESTKIIKERYENLERSFNALYDDCKKELDTFLSNAKETI